MSRDTGDTRWGTLGLMRSTSPATSCSLMTASSAAREQVRLGNIKRLIITVPPRSLKSITCSVALPAYVLSHDPTKRLIAASYSADLAIKHGNDFRIVVNSQEYRDIFPGMRISPMKNTQSEVVTTRNGFRLATSVDAL